MNRPNKALTRIITSSGTAASRGTLTIDDVIAKTAVLLGLTVTTGVVGWVLAPRAAGPLLGLGLVAFILSLFISFGRITSPVAIVAYAALEGLPVGAVAHLYDARSHGIASQAALGTVIVFAAMLTAYRFRWIRATERMRKVVFLGLMSVVVLSLIDAALYWVSGAQLPIINDATPLGIGFSLLVLVLASLQLVTDFDYAERAIAAGASKDTAWPVAYGLLIGLLWVFLEMLRLLSKLGRR